MDARNSLIESISARDQRVFIKMCLLLGHSGSIVHQNLVKICGNNALAKSTVEGWMTKFRKGEVSVEEARGGDRSDKVLKAQRIEQVKSLMDDDRHWSTRSLASRISLPQTTVSAILRNDLKMKKLLGKWIPHELSDSQRQMRVFLARQNIKIYNKTKAILQRTISIDESWVSLYMQPNRDQARSWQYPGEQPETVPRENIHGDKRMLIMAMSWDGIAFWELLPPKTTVTGEVYRGFLERYLKRWLGKRSISALWLHHDNARPHKHQLVKEYLAENKINIWEQPPYSPDISPLDYGCFSLLKRKLKGIHHQSWTEFERALDSAVEELNESGQMDAIQRLPDRWQRVIDSEGAYI